MTDEKVLQVIDRLLSKLPVYAASFPTRQTDLSLVGDNWLPIYQHCAWMLLELRVLIADGRREKAMRWLGFVQGVFAMKLCTLEDLKEMNLPDGSAFDGDRV